jgi:hypothetical protein
VELFPSVSSPYRAKFIKISMGVAAPNMGKVVDWQSYFWCFVRQTHSRPRAPESHILHINWRDFGQGDAFWKSRRYTSPRGVIPKTPHFGDGNVHTGFHLERLRAYLVTGKRIIMFDSSKCASRQDTICSLKKRGWGHSGVKFAISQETATNWDL